MPVATPPAAFGCNAIKLDILELVSLVEAQEHGDYLAIQQIRLFQDGVLTRTRNK